MKHRFKRSLFFVVLFFLVSPCGILLFPTPTSKPRSDWITKWLTNPTCQPPCWENVIPGETRIEDEVTILELLPGINKLRGPTKDPLSDIRQTVWQFGPSSGSITTQTDEKGELISDIYLNFNPDENLTVDEIVTAYGPPTNVSFYDCRTDLNVKSCEIHLVYKDKGMAVEFLVNDMGKGKYRVQILPDTKVFGVLLYPAVEDGYGITIGKNSFIYPKYLFDWTGYTYYP